MGGRLGSRLLVGLLIGPRRRPGVQGQAEGAGEGVAVRAGHGGAGLPSADGPPGDADTGGHVGEAIAAAPAVEADAVGRGWICRDLQDEVGEGMARRGARLAAGEDALDGVDQDAGAPGDLGCGEAVVAGDSGQGGANIVPGQDALHKPGISPLTSVQMTATILVE